MDAAAEMPDGAGDDAGWADAADDAGGDDDAAPVTQ
jgi:hypothetical protein